MVNKPRLVNQVAERTAQGISAMSVRQFILFSISFVGGIALARLLVPSDFGVFAIISFFIGLLRSLSDLGLKAALIQQKEEPTEKEQQSVFTFHIIFASAILVAVFILSMFFSQLFHLDDSVKWLIRVMSVVLILEAISIVPNICLERQLAYGKFAYMDVVKGIVYQSLVVLFAFFGFEVWSFVLAFLGSTISGVFLIFNFSPSRIGFSIDWACLKKSLRFGSVFQLGTMTSLLRDNVVVLLAGPLFGPAAVGYLRWAQDTAFVTSQVFTQIVARVSFPSLSRLQEYTVEFGLVAEKMLRFLMLFTAPSLAIFAALIPEIVHFVYSDKWSAAIPAFYFYSLRMLGGNITTPFISMIQALGRVRLALKVLIWWTIFDWFLAVVLARLFGFSGIAAAYAIGVWLPVVWLILEVRKVASINLWHAVGAPLLAAIFSGFLVSVIAQRFVSGIITLGLAGLMGFTIYGLALLLLERKRFLEELLDGIHMLGILHQSKSPF